MKIIFKKVRFKNFLLTGNSFTEIDLNSNSSTLFIGTNGCGKSQFEDAIFFALYNKPYRDINKPDLVNSINNKDCLVELEFEIASRQYMVRRGIKPNIFEIHCDGKKLDTDSNPGDFQTYLEKNILKMNSKAFKQIVILSKAAFVPFMQLPSGSRREIIESLLDLQVFSVMNVITKKKVQDALKIISDFDHSTQLLDQKIDLLKKNIDFYKSGIEDKILEKTKILNQLNFDIQNAKASKVSLSATLKSHLNAIVDLSIIEKKRQKLLSVQSQALVSQKNEDVNIKFFEDNDNCPTCSQPIEYHHKQMMVSQSNVKTKKIKSALEEMDNKISELDAQISKMKDHANKAGKLEIGIASKESEIKALQKQKDDIESEILSYKQDNKIVDLEKDLNSSVTLLEKANLDKQTELEKKSYLDVVLSLLKDDGIKSVIVERYLPIINKQINLYLSMMNLFVGLQLDENFDAIAKSRFRDGFSYNAFSEGQKARIDVSFVFTWRDIAKLKNSIDTNLLILDEVFDGSLDTMGSEDLMKILQNMKDTNLVVISHKVELLDKFDNVYRFIESRNFSRMERVV
jgi:DNA repair exonuclease SbcCD ATPase subunit